MKVSEMTSAVRLRQASTRVALGVHGDAEHGTTGESRAIVCGFGSFGTWTQEFVFDGMEKLTTSERLSLNDAIAKALQKSRTVHENYHLRIQVR